MEGSLWCSGKSVGLKSKRSSVETRPSAPLESGSGRFTVLPETQPLHTMSRQCGYKRHSTLEFLPFHLIWAESTML